MSNAEQQEALFTGRLDADMAEGADIPRQDMIYEYLAHRMGYGSPSGGDRHMLAAWGYDEPEIIEGKSGFAMSLFCPADGPTPETAEGPLRPVIVFRGTEPTQLSDLLTDLDPAGVGAAQVQENELVILDALRRLAGEGGKVDLLGHSLGGAIAQLVACAHPEFVGRIVGFQSPGVPTQMAHSVVAYNKHAGDAGEHQIDATYHVVDNDLVHRAGEARLPGQTYTHDNDARGPLSAHTGMILGGAARHQIDSIDKNEHPEGVSRNQHGEWSEPLRAGAGALLGRGKGSQEFERTSVVRNLFKGGHYLLEEIREPENRQRLEAAYPEIAAADRALQRGDHRGLDQIVESPPRTLSDRDGERLREYIQTWCDRRRQPNPLGLSRGL